MISLSSINNINNSKAKSCQINKKYLVLSKHNDNFQTQQVVSVAGLYFSKRDQKQPPADHIVMPSKHCELESTKQYFDDKT